MNLTNEDPVNFSPFNESGSLSFAHTVPTDSLMITETGGNFMQTESGANLMITE